MVRQLVNEYDNRDSKTLVKVRLVKQLTIRLAMLAEII